MSDAAQREAAVWCASGCAHLQRLRLLLLLALLALHRLVVLRHLLLPVLLIGIVLDLVEELLRLAIVPQFRLAFQHRNNDVLRWRQHRGVRLDLIEAVSTAVGEEHLQRTTAFSQGWDR